MDYTILVVTNESSIVEQYLEGGIYLYKNISLTVNEPIPVGDTPNLNNALEYLSIWEEHYNDIPNNLSYKFNNGIKDIDNGFKYRLVKIPFEGLAYIVMRDRKKKAVNNRYIILYMKEKNKSKMEELYLYDYKIDSRFNLNLDNLTEYYNKYVENNILLSDVYDPIENMVKANEIQHVSEFIEFLK